MNSRTHAKGLIFAISGALVISPDTLLIRLVDLDPWTLVLVRSVLSSLGVTTIVWLTSRRRLGSTIAAFRAVGRPGLWVAVISAAANILFIVAIDLTYVANVLVILAMVPLFVAILSRIALGERPSGATWLLSGTVILALGIVFSGSVSGDRLAGDFMALSVTLLLSIVLVIVRFNRSHSMVPAIAGSGIISALAVAPFASIASVGKVDFALLFLDGYIVAPLAVSLVTVAPRYIPAPDVALVRLLETALGPLWVWVALGEEPPVTTIAGGLAVVGILVIHASIQLSARRHGSADPVGLNL